MNACLPALLELLSRSRLRGAVKWVTVLTALSLLSSIAFAQSTGINGGGPNGGGGGGTPGGSSKQVQYNNSGAFGGVSNGTSGQVLTSNGASSTPSFQNATGGSPASPANSIQFNNGGVLGGSSNLLWDNTNGALGLGGSFGGLVQATTGNPLNLAGGNAITDATNSSCTLAGGGGLTGNGGSVTCNAGPAATSGSGGSVAFSAGNGAGTNQNGGAVTIAAGTSTGSATNGAISLVTHGSTRFTLQENGSWNIGGTGSAGNVLSSNGSGSTPTWGALSATALPAFTGDATSSAGSSALTIPAGTVTNAKLANQTASTVKCNATTSAAAPSDCNPLQVANLVGAVLAVDVVSTTNLALTGLQTIDGQAGFAGEVVLLTGQTTQSEDGLYVMASGAWSRAINFPSGYVIPQFCNLSVWIQKGTQWKGSSFFLVTSSNAVTIGTTNQAWSSTTIPRGTTTVLGIVTVTANATKVAAVTLSPANAGGATGDCVEFQDSAGSVGDGNALGNFGPCILGDAAGHPLFTNASSLPPTTSAGSLDAAANDARGRVTGLTAATAVTITFKASWTYAPSCGGSTSAATAVGVSAVSTSAVTFSTSALTGSLNYWCF